MASQAAQHIRYAAHGLVAAWADHDRRSAEVLQRVTDEAAVVARLVDAVRPGGPALASTVTAELTLGVGAATRELAAVTAVLSGEARALLALLFDDASLSAAAIVLPPPGTGTAGIIGTFPPGPPRDYVAHILTDHPSSSAQPVRDAAHAPVTGSTAPAHLVEATAVHFDTPLHEAVHTMFAHPQSHAIQVHGPDVALEALQARISWRKDPAGRTTSKHLWTLNPDDTVLTKHPVGAEAGRFNSIEALVKPLKAVVAQSGGTLASLDAYLITLGPNGQVRLFVEAGLAGLQPGDTAAFRGAGARTPDMAEHWKDGRQYAIDTGAAPMPIVATDQIADGSDPGAAIIFRKFGHDWVVITCYPTAEQPRNFTRLGGSTQ